MSLLLFVPDVSMIGYAKSRRVGAMLYNAAYCYVAPAVLGTVATLAGETLWQPWPWCGSRTSAWTAPWGTHTSTRPTSTTHTSDASGTDNTTRPFQ